MEPLVPNLFLFVLKLGLLVQPPIWTAPQVIYFSPYMMPTTRSFRRELILIHVPIHWCFTLPPIWSQILNTISNAVGLLKTRAIKSSRSEWNRKRWSLLKAYSSQSDPRPFVLKILAMLMVWKSWIFQNAA